MVSVSLAIARDVIVNRTAPNTPERSLLLGFLQEVVTPSNECFSTERFGNAVERVSQETAIQQLLSGKA